MESTAKLVNRTDRYLKLCLALSGQIEAWHVGPKLQGGIFDFEYPRRRGGRRRSEVLRGSASSEVGIGWSNSGSVVLDNGP